MIDFWNRVITNLIIAEGDTCKNVVSTASDVPAKFPTLLVDQLAAYDAAVDLENSEAAVNSQLELTSYSNKSLSEAREVMNKACDAMRVMGYIRSFGPRQVPNIDKNIYRMVTRFHRIICDGDHIDKFPTGATGATN